MMEKMLSTKEIWSSYIKTNQIQSATLPEYIMDSWEYCSSHDVNPLSEKGLERVSLLELDFTKSEIKDVIQLVQWEISRLAEFFDMKKPLFILTDKNGVVVWRDGHAETKHLANDIRFEEGSIWTEKAVGTNAIGLALRTLQSVTVEKYQHFSQASHPFTCTSTPILDENGDVVACLNVSTAEKITDANYLMVALKILAKNVETSLLERYVQNKKIELLEYVAGPLERMIICDEQERIVMMTRDFDTDPAKHLGQPIALFLEHNPEYYQKTPICVEREYLGSVYQFSLKRETLSYVSFGVASHNEQYQTYLNQLLKAAESDLPIHLYGETGSGKEVSAKTVHYNSARHKGPLISVNCGALSENLLESELFGYVPGAFTGAQGKGYKGKIAQADGGTLFLDEIDSMSKRMQVSLLRVLEEKIVTPLGAENGSSVDFRLVTASNQNLKEQVAKEQFREDLFYRLFVIPFSIPPLRERQEDFCQLVSQYCERQDWHPKWIDAVIEEVKQYEWQGNIREFHNFLKRLHLFYPDCQPSSADIERLVSIGTIEKNKMGQKTIEKTEAQQITQTLKETNYHMTQTAERLNMARSTLYRKITKYQIEIPD